MSKRVILKKGEHILNGNVYNGLKEVSISDQEFIDATNSNKIYELLGESHDLMALVEENKLLKAKIVVLEGQIKAKATVVVSKPVVKKADKIIDSVPKDGQDADSGARSYADIKKEAMEKGYEGVSLTKVELLKYLNA